VELANGTMFKIISNSFKEQKKDFKSIFKSMRESLLHKDGLLSEATWWEDKYNGKVMEIKPIDNPTSVKIASYFNNVAGRKFVKVAKEDIPANTNIIQVGSEANTKKYRLGELGKTNASYFKGEDDGLYYVIVGLPTAAISEFKLNNGKRVASGAKATDLQESSVAQLIALAANNKKYKNERDLVSFLIDMPEDIIITEIKRYADKYDTTSTVEETIEYLRAVPQWIKQNALIATSFVNDFNINSNYTSHRGSSTSNALESLGVQLAQKVDNSVKQKDKWNPADIWVENNSGNLSDIMNSKTIVEMYESLRKSVNKNKIKAIIGVSLKAVGKSVEYSFYNFDSDKALTTVEINNVETAKKGIAKGIRVKDTKKPLEINFRNSAGSKFVKSLAGIISGKFAQMGSVTNKLLFDRLKETVPVFPHDAKFYFEKDGTPTLKSYELYRKYVEEAKMNLKRIKVNKLSGEIFDIDSFEDYEELTNKTVKDNKTTKGAAFAINSSLIALSLLSKINQETFNYAYDYASAQLDVSGPFLKIH